MPVAERSPAQTAVLAVFVVDAVACAVVTAADWTMAHDITTALLMPLLVLWVAVAARRPWPRPQKLLLGGMVFAWLGDLALLGTGDVRFIAGIALFLVMQVLYILAFRSVPGPGLVRAWPLLLVPYAVAWLALAAAMVLHSGADALPGLVYGLVLVAMAVSALDLVLRVRPQANGWRTAGGAALFLLSDALIALTAFAGVPSSTWLSVAVMVTYAAAQGLIVTGFTRAVIASAAV